MMHQEEVAGRGTREIHGLRILRIGVLLVGADQVAHEAGKTPVQVLVQVLRRVGRLEPVRFD